MVNRKVSFAFSEASTVSQYSDISRTSLSQSDDGDDYFNGNSNKRIFVRRRHTRQWNGSCLNYKTNSIPFVNEVYRVSQSGVGPLNRYVSLFKLKRYNS